MPPPLKQRAKRSVLFVALLCGLCSALLLSNASQGTQLAGATTAKRLLGTAGSDTSHLYVASDSSSEDSNLGTSGGEAATSGTSEAGGTTAAGSVDGGLSGSAASGSTDYGGGASAAAGSTDSGGGASAAASSADGSGGATGPASSTDSGGGASAAATGADGSEGATGPASSTDGGGGASAAASSADGGVGASGGGASAAASSTDSGGGASVAATGAEGSGGATGPASSTDGGLGGPGGSANSSSSNLRYGSSVGPAINGSAIGVTIYRTAQQRCRGPAQNETVPNLMLVSSWESYRPIQRQHVTLVTQVTLDRLEMLENQCKSWPHALAVAAYVPQLTGPPAPDNNFTEAGVRQAEQQLAQLHSRLGQQQGACNLQLQLYTELCDQETLDRYPANALRNRVLQMVQTEAVLMLDVDFIVSHEFGRELNTTEGWQSVRRKLEVVPAVVVPAFVPKINELRRWGGGRVEDEKLEWGRALAFEAAAGGKEWVVNRFRLARPHIALFNWGTAARRNTRVGKWFQANDYYDIEYEKHFEPDIIILRENVPWYDERFRGYGLNKAVEFLALSQWGATFCVHPRGYAVHVPHPWSKTQRVSMESQLVNKNFELFDHVLAYELPGEKYYPVTSFADKCPQRPPGMTR